MNSIEKNDSIEDNFTLNKSTHCKNTDALYKRANSKYFTLGVVMHLVNLDSPLRKRYWSSYYCASQLVQKGDKITSIYCRSRWCITCSRIRTAQAIGKYSEAFDSWGKEKYFVTLTIPNVKAEFLADAIDKMQKNFTNINRYFRERLKRPLIGIRKLEVTYNPQRDDYHPHYHIVVKGYESAVQIKEQWLIRYPDAKEYLQDIVECYGDKAKFELFKYVTKVISTKSVSNHKLPAGVSSSERRKIYINALDTIFIALDRRKTFETFGFKPNKVDISSKENVECDVTDEIYFWDWSKEFSDWLCDDTGVLLTGYVPPDNLKKLLENDVVLTPK